jgi:hypothetical protein
MKCLVFITLNFVFVINSYAMGNWGGRPQTQTEAGVCAECDRRAAFQGQPVAPIDLNYVRSDGKGTILDAIKQFELFVKNNPQCTSKTRYGIISNLSDGTADNVSNIVEIGSNGKVKVVASFWAGEGHGVSNDCGSNGSPSGFLKIGKANVRSDIDRKDPTTGQLLRSEWPMCGKLNPGFKYNRMALCGLEPGYNDNTCESNARMCPNGLPRLARLHSIKYASGNTTQGCKGLQLEDWCKWAPKLEGGCAYNFDGYPSPAVKKLMKTKSI